MDSITQAIESKYPAKQHARAVAKWIVDNGGSEDALIYLEAQKLKYNEASPTSSHFPIEPATNPS